MTDRSSAPIAIGAKAQVERSRSSIQRNTTKMTTRASTSSAAMQRNVHDEAASSSSASRSGSGSTPMAAPSTPAKEMTLNNARSSASRSAGNGKERQTSSATASGSWTPGSSSSLSYLSESMRSSDQYAIYDMNHFRYGGSSYNGTPSPLIVSSVGQGFSWSRDVFLSRYGQEHYGDGGYGTPEERIEAHEIILDDEPMFEDL